MSHPIRALATMLLLSFSFELLPVSVLLYVKLLFPFYLSALIVFFFAFFGGLFLFFFFPLVGVGVLFLLFAFVFFSFSLFLCVFTLQFHFQ